MFKIAVVGSGPSGLFLCKNLLKSFQNKVKIDIFEKLSEPLGLLRFGVAPDHSDVKKKFMRHFDSIFDSENVQVFTNVNIGQEFRISNLSERYDAVALCTGMSDSKRYWQSVPNCRGADEIFGWYNQNPKFKNLDLDFTKVQNLVIIGNGNVALDMARIFAKKHHLLDNNDMHPEVLKVLRNVDVKEITIIGRRGIENASFSPAELREFGLFSEYCKITAIPELNNSEHQNFSRIQAKLYQIMQDLVKNSNQGLPKKKIRFVFSSPVSSVEKRNGHGIVKVAHNNQKLEHFEFDLLIECTGFKQNQIFEELSQDEVGKFVTNDRYCIKDNIYSCGWARTGPKGSIADSIVEASNCAKSIFTDLSSGASKKN